MPNWCNNTLELYHDKPEMIDRVDLAAQQNKLFSEFFPCPKELHDTVAGNVEEGYATELHDFQKALNIKYFGHTDWYSWNNANWGTKWEVCEINGGKGSDNSINLAFDTAWSPPIEFYEKMKEIGFVVRAYYYEPGMAFCGFFDDGEEDYYEIKGNSDWVTENIPSDIDEMFCISEGMAEFEEEYGEQA